MTTSIFWLLLMALFIFIEIISLGLITVWFALGSFVAFIISLFTDCFILEIALFLSSSIALLCFIRPRVTPYIKLRKLQADYEELLGKKALVTYTIGKQVLGQVDLEGQLWPAISLDGTIIEKNTVVKVNGLSGKRLIVYKMHHTREDRE